MVLLKSSLNFYPFSAPYGRVNHILGAEFWDGGGSFCFLPEVFRDYVGYFPINQSFREIYFWREMYYPQGNFLTLKKMYLCIKSAGTEGKDVG